MKSYLAKMFVSASLLGVMGTAISTEPFARPSGDNSALPAQDRSGCGLPPSRKIDEYVSLGPDAEKTRLDKFAAAVEDEPEDTKGFIIAYAVRGGRSGQARADRAKEYLVEKQVMLNTRLNTLDCGHREAETIELWITPVGAAPPSCTPSVKSVDAHPGNVGGRPDTSRPASGSPARRSKQTRVKKRM